MTNNKNLKFTEYLLKEIPKNNINENHLKFYNHLKKLEDCILQSLKNFNLEVNSIEFNDLEIPVIGIPKFKITLYNTNNLDGEKLELTYDIDGVTKLEIYKYRGNYIKEILLNKTIKL